MIKQLKSEHVYILEKFTKIEKFGLATDEVYSEAWNARNALSSHLLKEDKLLYPYLRGSAEQNDDLRTMMVIFDYKVKALARLADEFYSGYTVKTNLSSILDKFKVVFEQFKLRVKHEEEFLFKEFL